MGLLSAGIILPYPRAGVKLFLRDPVIFFFAALNGGRVRINRAQGRNTVEKECVWNEKGYLALRCLRGGGGGGLDLAAALPYLIGGTAGGWLGGRWFRGVRVLWLRRAFGLLMLYGGARCLL